jgi:hypothetical protein
MRQLEKLVHEVMQNVNEESTSSDAGAYLTPKAFKKKKCSCKKPINETISKIIKEEILNELSYNKFRNEVKYRTKSEMLHKGIREVKRKLVEVDQLIEYTTRIKQELSENESGSGYWKRSLKAINEISEISNKISNKLKEIYQ